MFVIFDLDGTLSDDTHRRHHVLQQPKDFGAYHAALGDDKPRSGMASLVRTLAMVGHRIEVWTARPEIYRGVTEKWLERNIMPNLKLFMRPEGDSRSANQLKGSWLEDAAPIRPDLVFDDRRKNVQFWRGLGITCCQVEDNT